MRTSAANYLINETEKHFLSHTNESKQIVNELLSNETLDAELGLPNGMLGSDCGVAQAIRGGTAVFIFDNKVWNIFRNKWNTTSLDLGKSSQQAPFVARFKTAATPTGKGAAKKSWFAQDRKGEKSSGDNPAAMCRDIEFNRFGTIFSCSNKWPDKETPFEDVPLNWFTIDSTSKLSEGRWGYLQPKGKSSRTKLEDAQKMGWGPSDIIFPTKYNGPINFSSSTHGDDDNTISGKGGGVGLYYNSDGHFCDGPANDENVLYKQILYAIKHPLEDGKVRRACDDFDDKKNIYRDWNAIFAKTDDGEIIWGYKEYWNTLSQPEKDELTIKKGGGVWTFTGTGAEPQPIPVSDENMWETKPSEMTGMDYDNYRNAAKFYNNFCKYTIELVTGCLMRSENFPERMAPALAPSSKVSSSPSSGLKLTTAEANKRAQISGIRQK